MVVPVIVGTTSFGGSLALAGADFGVEIVIIGACVRLAKAGARDRVEVLTSRAVLVGTNTLAVFVHLAACWADNWHADTRAGVLVPGFPGFTRVMIDDALKFAGRAVPRLSGWRAVRWGAGARAGAAVPDLALRAFVFLIANAGASVKVPVVVVVVALALNADTLSGKDVPLFKFIVTILHCVAARAVQVSVVRCSVHILAGWTNDEITIVVNTWLKLTWNDGDSMLDLSLCKICTNLLFDSCKG